MTKELTVNLDVDTTKLQRILAAVSKHTEALAKELAEIERMQVCECGSTDFTTIETAKFNSIVYDCNGCGEVFAIKKQVEETE